MFNQRILMISAVIAVLVALLMFSDRNRGRFMPSGVEPYVLDTRTGQYCDPGMGLGDVPKCADLAKRWW